MASAERARAIQEFEGFELIVMRGSPCVQVLHMKPKFRQSGGPSRLLLGEFTEDFGINCLVQEIPQVVRLESRTQV